MHFFFLLVGFLLHGLRNKRIKNSTVSLPGVGIKRFQINETHVLSSIFTGQRAGHRSVCVLGGKGGVDKIQHELKAYHQVSLEGSLYLHWLQLVMKKPRIEIFI